MINCHSFFILYPVSAIVYSSKLRGQPNPASVTKLMKICKIKPFCNKIRKIKNGNEFATNSDFLIFQTINSVRSNSLSLKYQRFTPSGCKAIGVRKCKFVAKTQLL